MLHSTIAEEEFEFRPSMKRFLALCRSLSLHATATYVEPNPNGGVAPATVENAFVRGNPDVASFRTESTSKP